MQASSSLLFALLLALVAGSFAQIDPSGQSYCNAGECTLTTVFCDLGLCCTANNTSPTLDMNGTCVDPSTLPTYESGGACELTNPCMTCPMGEACIEGNCTVPEPAECSSTFDCECDQNSDCQSNFCADDNVCRTIGLGANDRCHQDEQCLSGICNTTTSLCQGIAEGEECPFTGFSNPCAYGLICSGNFVEASCANGSAVGEECSSSADCYEFASSCVDGTCISANSQGEGDTCGSSSDCQFGLRCHEQECASIEGEQCNSLFCPQGFFCECSGENTRCVQNENSCQDERQALIACMREHQCTTFPLLYPTEEYCAFQCVDEIANAACCIGCGGEANDVITFPSSFLECGETNTYNYVPQCDTCNFPVSTCPSAPTGTGSDGTGTGEDNSAAAVVPFLASFAIFLSCFF